MGAVPKGASGLARPIRRVGIGIACFGLGVLAVEVVCRMAACDFSGRERAYRSWPVFYRLPRVPVGTVFFRREGGQTWRGKVLSAGLARAGIRTAFYADEEPITVAYDRDGFRNPPDLTDWDIVVAGDSFVELGHLPDDDLFTTRLGSALGVRVKNLGATGATPLSCLCYLREFGLARSTRLAVMVFFEGNDLAEMETEARWLRTLRETGVRPLRGVAKQTSFLGALRAGLRFPATRAAAGPASSQAPAWNALFQGATGDVPVTVAGAPASPSRLSAEQANLIRTALSDWASVADAAGVEPWLLYMPCKRRVLSARLRPAAHADAALVLREESDLREVVTTIAGECGVGVVDATAALERETGRGILTFNTVWDTHLNRRGSHVVAQALADRLGKTGAIASRITRMD